MGKVRSRALAVRMVYEQRIGRHVSIKEVADAVGMTRSALSKLEANKTGQISFETLEKLCTFYNVRPGDLLDYEEWLARYAAQSEHQTT